MVSVLRLLWMLVTMSIIVPGLTWKEERERERKKGRNECTLHAANLRTPCDHALLLRARAISPSLFLSVRDTDVPKTPS